MKHFFTILRILFFLDGCTKDRTQRVYQSRIVHGELAEIKDYPYHVYVTGERAECGGTIIGTRWIMTAGHCISHPVDMMIVYVSTEDIQMLNPDNEYPVDHAYLHPDFRISPSSMAYEFDCAILKLVKDLVYGPTVKPVVLSKNEDLVEGKFGDIAGFGISERDDETLKVLHLPLMLYHSCLAKYRDYSVHKNSEFCVGGADEGKTPCSGDSGGGFVADGKLLGVFISAQGTCEDGRRIVRPALFFMVPIARQWICDITGIL